MLRESIRQSGAEFDLAVAMGTARGDGGIDGGQALADFAEAVTLGGASRIAAQRRALEAGIGARALVDAAAVAAAFHGFVRVADATGAPPSGASGGKVTAAFREELGIDDFYGARHL